MGEQELDFTPQCPHLEWLTDHLGGWQFGEQDLLATVAITLRLSGPHVEIGAGDGESLPLTLSNFRPEHLILYEQEHGSREKLRSFYPLANINGAYIGQRLPENVGVCVIDVDSIDSVIMRQVMQRDKPTVVVCEHLDRKYCVGTSAPDPIPQWMLGMQFKSNHRIQDTAETLHWMASQLGYERFGYNRCNSFFVRREYYTKLFA